MSSSVILTGMFISLIALMLTGAPLAFVLGAIAFLTTIIVWEPSALIVGTLNTFKTMKSEALMAIPLYVLMAAILQKAGIIEALYSAMEKWFARLSGGLAIGTIIICTIMAAMTGIVGAAVAAMGILALPSMLQRKYNVELSVGTICAGGTLGILIPPSVVTIVYAITAQISIGKMFIASVVPGVILAGAYCTYIAIRVALTPQLAPPPDNAAEVSLAEKILSLRALILPLIVIFSVLGSIYMGLATPTEAAAVGVLGAVSSAFTMGKFRFHLLSEACGDTLRITSMILWITIGAKAFISTFNATGAPDSLLSFIEGLNNSPVLIILAMLLLLIFLGLFLDEIGIILLCVPVFLPIVNSLGYDPLWFGILFMITAQMAYITPPFGYTLFYLKSVLPNDIGIARVYRGVLPFFFIQLLVLGLFILFPDLVTWLPDQIREPR
ncbi:MAG: TRAP transporter large permease subunit [Hyphomicrobiales bacterium]